MKQQFRSRKDASKYLLTKGIDTSNWTDVQWLKLNKGQAEIHMMALAEAMWDAYNESTPKQLKAGEWHIPFINKIDRAEIGAIAEYDGIKLTSDGKISDSKFYEYAIKIATVMAARTSYTVVGEDQKPLSYERMIQIHDDMLAANPKHLSPFEHCAKVMNDAERLQNLNGQVEVWNVGEKELTISTETQDPEASKVAAWCGNFKGFIQYRKMIPNENITK
jgi:hypothetical protein